MSVVSLHPAGASFGTPPRRRLVDVRVVGAADVSVAGRLTPRTPPSGWNNPAQFEAGHWYEVLDVADSVVLYDPMYPRSTSEEVFEMKKEAFSPKMADQDNYTVAVSFIGGCPMQPPSPPNIFWVDFLCGYSGGSADVVASVVYLAENQPPFPNTLAETYHLLKRMRLEGAPRALLAALGPMFYMAFKPMFARDPAEVLDIKRAVNAALAAGDLDNDELWAFSQGRVAWFSSSGAYVSKAAREAAVRVFFAGQLPPVF